MFRDAWLIAKKDIRIELSSKVIFAQVLPFSLLFVVLAGMVVTTDFVTKGAESRNVLEQVAPAVFWIIATFAAIMALGRSQAVESSNGNLDALRMAGLDPAGIFLGKAAAVFIQLLALELIVGFAAFTLYGVPLASVGLLAATVLATTLAVASSGMVYAAVAAGTTTRETFVPLLILPVLLPVLLAATRATESALFGVSGGWNWSAALFLFSLLYVGIGMLTFDVLMEES